MKAAEGQLQTSPSAALTILLQNSLQKKIKNRVCWLWIILQLKPVGEGGGSEPTATPPPPPCNLGPHGRDRASHFLLDTMPIFVRRGALPACFGF